MAEDEKKAHLEAEIKKAIESGDETYLKYIIHIKNLTINVAAYGQVFFNTGNPPPLPPYGGGG